MTSRKNLSVLTGVAFGLLLILPSTSYGNVFTDYIVSTAMDMIDVFCLITGILVAVGGAALYIKKALDKQEPWYMFVIAIIAGVIIVFLPNIFTSAVGDASDEMDVESIDISGYSR